MKRLGAFVFVTVLLLGVFGVSAAPKAYAQSIDRVIDNGAIPSQGTYDYFYNQGVGILDSTITALQGIQTTVSQLQNEPNKQQIAATLAKYVQIFQDEKLAYVSTFNQAKSSATVPVEAQIQAMVAAEAKFQEGWQTLSPKEKQEPRGLGIVKTYSTQWAGLLTQAKQIEAGSIAANSPEANSLGNATAVSTAGKSAETVVKNNDANKCRITNVSLVDCVDVLFTWVIKNTLLQIAGFFVWLTANMLNYAIQISILDFSSWAPNSLYPVWVVIRQIVSLFVVFAGLYLGFMYIVGRTEVFSQYIAWVILFALFVNFSYPFARVLVDVSNIVSLNVYNAAVGPQPLLTDFSTSAIPFNGQSTAGAIIMQKLGLQGLVASATDVKGAQSGFIDQINSTPGALLTLAFVLYAAYIFFMATAIIAMRAAVLVFLIVASPLLLVDSVIPKLGDAAVKLRKMFFEQLVVAPVFMIMFALTIKFMDVFQTGGPLGVATPGALTGGADSIKVFFSVLMMLIMLHIMLKVTKSIAGQAGEYATSALGKVGGFGLGVAAGGAGFLARGSIGAAAARARDSGWMDKLQGSRTGRGLYSLTNSLAQSSYDSRNIGMLNRGMATAGLKVGVGSKQNYDKTFAEKQTTFNKKYYSIKDAGARKGYLDQTQNGVKSTIGRAILRKSDGDLITEKVKKSRADVIKMYNTFTDPAKKEAYRREHEGEIRVWEQEQAANKAAAKVEEPKPPTEEKELTIETPAEAEARVNSAGTSPQPQASSSTPPAGGSSGEPASAPMQASGPTVDSVHTSSLRKKFGAQKSADVIDVEAKEVSTTTA